MTLRSGLGKQTWKLESQCVNEIISVDEIAQVNHIEQLRILIFKGQASEGRILLRKEHTKKSYRVGRKINIARSHGNQEKKLQEGRNWKQCEIQPTNIRTYIYQIKSGLPHISLRDIILQIKISLRHSFLIFNNQTWSLPQELSYLRFLEVIKSSL